MSEEEAERVLYEDPKNPIKLAIKHVLIKTKLGTRFYYYMHKLSLMYGHFVRRCLAVFGILLLSVSLIYAGSQNQTILQFLANLGTNLSLIGQAIALYGGQILSSFFALLGVIIIYAVMAAFWIMLALIVAYIVYSLAVIVYKIVINVIAAIFF